MNKSLEFIGLSGTNGSGKDTVGEMLAKHHGYLFFSGSELLRSEAKRRALAPDREVLRTISAEWRRELGLGVLIDKAIAEYEKDQDKYSGLVIASLRNPGEADRIHDFGGTVVWIDADPQVRYDRIRDNVATRNRAQEDNKTFEEFKADEEIEMHVPLGGDEAMLDMAGVRARSDVFINNDSNNLDTFHLTIAKALGLR